MDYVYFLSIGSVVTAFVVGSTISYVKDCDRELSLDDKTDLLEATLGYVKDCDRELSLNDKSDFLDMHTEVSELITSCSDHTNAEIESLHNEIHELRDMITALRGEITFLSRNISRELNRNDSVQNEET